MRNSTKSIKKAFAKRGWVLLSEYVNSKTKLRYKCDKGHVHSIRLDHFRRGVGCPFCSGKFKKSVEYINNKVSEEGYSLLSSEYKNAFTKLTLRCPEGHIFKSSWHNWNNGNHRCPYCYGGVKLSTEYVKDKLEVEGYQLKDAYINSKTPLKCTCANGHIYYVLWGNFISKKTRCPICSGVGRSYAEDELISLLNDYDVKCVSNNRSLIKPYELDIVLLDLKIAIEYCGLYWHSELNGKNRYYHLNKLEACISKGFQLITIFEDEWVYKKSIVESRLLAIINSAKLCKLYARKCVIQEISAREARLFCEENHLQGYGAGASIKLGAFYEGYLVAVMTFARPSLAKGYRYAYVDVWELHRFCTKLNYQVIGIASKLLNFFEHYYTWRILISYADRRWSSGKLYDVLGFDFVGCTKPNYWYIDGKKRKHRFSFRKTADDIQVLSEWENRVLEGYDRIWDCGNLKYMKHNEV